ncbi:MAG: hypothetical protein WBD16_04970 [Pyrinomonadaceae bacterium]
MKKLRFQLLAVSVIVSLLSVTVFAQKKPVVKTPNPIIFAVLNDGKTLEPIAYVNKGKLEASVNGSDEKSIIAAFNKSYYKAGTSYRLIFGAANAGTVTVKSSDSKSECSANMAEAITKATKTPLKGLVMGLATNAVVKNTVSVRRRPTPAERTEIEALVKNEFVAQKLTPKTLKYHNLTALDLENDGKVEFVGTFWVDIDNLTRGLLFFIAAQGKNGKYAIGFKDYRSIDQASVMSGDIKNVDEGVYHELLLDAFDYNGDGVSEVFTYIQSFEGAGFNVYAKNGAAWANVFEGANYHCGY